MSEVKTENGKRADRAVAALVAYNKSIGVEPEVDDFPEERITDLLTDLMHLCDLREDREPDFHYRLERAYDNYGYEKAEEQEALARAKDTYNECPECGHRIHSCSCGYWADREREEGW